MAIFYQNPVKEGTHHANQESTPKGTPEIPYLKTGNDKGDAEEEEGIDQPGKETKRKDVRGRVKSLITGLITTLIIPKQRAAQTAGQIPST